MLCLQRASRAPGLGAALVPGSAWAGIAERLYREPRGEEEQPWYGAVRVEPFLLGFPVKLK